MTPFSSAKARSNCSADASVNSGAAVIAAAKLDQQVAGGGVLEEFRHRCGIEGEMVAEVGTKRGGEVGEAAGARLDEIDGGENVGLAARGE